jgi:hypothetical protein
VLGLSSADNPREWATRAVQNQSSAVCAECHESTNDSWKASAHTSVSCENCHGPTKSHIEKARNHEEAPLAVADARDLCLKCHAAVSSRPASFPQVEALTHGALAEGVTTSCTSCHNSHNPGIPPEITHTLVERSDCLACHGPEEWKPIPKDHLEIAPDACLKCHTLKEEG